MGHGASLAQSHANTVAPSPPTGCPGESPETEVVLESRKHSPKSNFLKHSCFHTDQHVNHDAHAEERRVSDAVWGEGRGRKGRWFTPLSGQRLEEQELTFNFVLFSIVFLILISLISALFLYDFFVSVLRLNCLFSL